MTEFSQGLRTNALHNERITSAIAALDTVDSFMRFLDEFEFNLADPYHYHLLFEHKLLVWIESPAPPSNHKWVIERLGGYNPKPTLYRPTLFWTSFLCVYFSEFFFKQSKDLTDEDVELIEMTCRLIQRTCRYGTHGECFDNIKYAGEYGACQFLSRTLRYYRDRKTLVDAALNAVSCLTHSKKLSITNPNRGEVLKVIEELNQNARYSQECEDAPMVESLYKVLKRYAIKGSHPETLALTLKALHNVMKHKCSSSCRSSFGNIPGACEVLFKSLKFYGVSATASHKVRTALTHEALKALTSLSEDDRVRDTFWNIPVLCEGILGSMWSCIDDPGVVHSGFKAIIALIHRDEGGTRRELFGSKRYSCRLSQVEVGICNIFFKVASSWVLGGYPHCVEEGVSCLSHLSYKDNANLAIFHDFWDDSEAEIAAIRYEKFRIKTALVAKLSGDMEEAKKTGKEQKVKILDKRLPRYLRPVVEEKLTAATSSKVDGR